MIHEILANLLMFIQLQIERKDAFYVQRLLGALGGGGNKGTPPPVDDAPPETPELDPRRLLDVGGLLRPGMAIEKVCPSFRL